MVEVEEVERSIVNSILVISSLFSLQPLHLVFFSELLTVYRRGPSRRKQRRAGERGQRAGTQQRRKSHYFVSAPPSTNLATSKRK